MKKYCSLFFYCSYALVHCLCPMNNALGTSFFYKKKKMQTWVWKRRSKPTLNLFFFLKKNQPPTHKWRILPLVGNLSHPPLSLFLRMRCECNTLLEYCSRGSFSHKCSMASWCSEFNVKEMVAFSGNFLQPLLEIPLFLRQIVSYE